MTMYHANARKLQEAMRLRRKALEISQKEVSSRGGPSRVAIARYELGEIPADIRPSTLRKIEQALGWPTGYATELLKIEEPQQDPRVSEDTLLEFVKAVANMQRVMAAETADIPDEVREAMADVALKQTDLLLGLTTRN